MSFLSEILISKGLAEVEELNEKIQQMSKSVASLKEEVMATMDDKYINYTCVNDNTNYLINKVKILSSQINNVTERIDSQMKNELSASNDHLEVLMQTLQEVTLAHELIGQLMKIHTALDTAQDLNSSKCLESAQQLKVAEDDLKSNTSGLECLDIFEALESELTFQQRRHSYNALTLWSQCFSWSETTVDNSCVTVTLKLATDLDKEELFKALYYHHLLSNEMQELSERFLNKIFYPIMSQSTIVDFEGNTTLSLKINSHEKSPPCLKVLNTLTIVFNFLSNQLNLKAEDEVDFISYLKTMISDDFCNYLIKNCLSLMVPKKHDELESYMAVVEEIIAFEILLKDIGFLAEDDKRIAEYTTNVEELFVNKTCEAYLSAARNIMKKDLHDIKKVGPVESTAPADLEVTVHLTALSPDTFQFPSCQISKSSDELLELVRDVLQQIPQNNDAFAARLFYTVRNIFSMYCDVVPEYHNRLLDTIPQQSAILHNNAMYLAHQMMVLGPQYKPLMPSVQQTHTTTFIDLVDTLRSLASKLLINQLQMQKKQIIDILRDSGLVTLSDSPKFPMGIEKAIRQCLRQLLLLQTVWQKVLPFNTYCKAQGLLCNALLEEIVQKVIAAEDIPVDTAAQLVVVFTLIQQKAPQVFPEPQEIHRHVKKWAKFVELQLLLGAGLREVDDRWADGKGPLAQEFTADQVRHLVRALFQISDRRAVVLAKII